jgi:hypothetical protein
MTAHEKGLISPADFISGMEESRDAIYEQIGAILDMDDAMLDYYGDTLAAAGEEIGKYTDKMDHLNTVLDHYTSLVKLMGKEKDYKVMHTMLTTAADLAKQRVDVSAAEYEMYS